MKKYLSTSKPDFQVQYSELCHENKICPLRVTLKYLKGTEAHLSPSTIRSDHWAVFLKALCTDNSLTTISLYADSNKKKKRSRVPIKATSSHSATKTQKQIVGDAKKRPNIGHCLKSCLETSQVLRTLKLEYIPLTSVDLELLANGIRHSTCLQMLSLKGNLNDRGVEAICRGLKNVFTIDWVDFSDSIFSLDGLQAIIAYLKHQADKRLVEIWEQTLRYRIPNLDTIIGIRRISLNNVKIGDAGAEILSETLVHDLWIKAIDLQNCDIHDKGTTSFKRVLNSNCILEILDLRFNPISDHVQAEISKILRFNNVGKILKYTWFPSLENQTTVKVKIKKGKS